MVNKGIKLFCNYELNKDESFRSIVWKKWGQGVYSWDALDDKLPTAENAFFDKVDLTYKPQDVVHIRKAVIGMKGEYECIVTTTDYKTATARALLTVIGT